MKASKFKCVVCDKPVKPRNNVELGRLAEKSARVSCSEVCRRELRRIQQAKRRGKRGSMLIPQVRFA